MKNEFHRYLAAGLLNTAIGYASFLIALHALGLTPITSNGISYAIGLLSAYIMNGAFVFKKSRHSIESLLRFILGFFIAYAINIGTLHSSTEYIGLRPEIAQIFAMASYTISFYFINKYFVWKKH